MTTINEIDIAEGIHWNEGVIKIFDSDDTIDLPQSLLGGLFEEALTCCICMDILDGTVATECLHRFCRECIGRHLRQIDKAMVHECPLCRVKINSTRKLKKDPKMDEFIKLFQAETLVNKANMMVAIANASSVHKKNTEAMKKLQRTKSDEILRQIEEDKVQLKRQKSMDREKEKEKERERDAISGIGPKAKKRREGGTPNLPPAPTRPTTAHWKQKYPNVLAELERGGTGENPIIDGFPIKESLLVNSWVQFSIYPHPSEAFLWDLPKGNLIRTKGSASMRSIKQFVLSELKNSTVFENIATTSRGSSKKPIDIKTFQPNDIDFYCNIPLVEAAGKIDDGNVSGPRMSRRDSELVRIDSSELTVAELNAFFRRRCGGAGVHLVILYTLYE